MNLSAPPLPLFNPQARLSSVPLGGGQQCLVLDDALAEPERLVDWARTAAFAAPDGFPYPGQVVPAPVELTGRLNDYFGLQLRGRLGGRRTLDAQARLSLVTTPPEALAPRQWQCHRDRIAVDPREVLFAASVLYLFRDPALGGTSFYQPRRSPAETDQMIAASQLLSAVEFSQRYGVQPGYMAGSNDWFEQVARVPAAWNRFIFYDGSLFHSAEVGDAALLSSDPARGRLTLNGFMTCTRPAR